MRKQDAWARLWQSGALTSFGSRFASGYEGAARQLWIDLFESLPDGAVVVDLGAGNGALEEIAEDFCESEKRKMTLHAFDLATIVPERYRTPTEGECEVVWHSGSRNEATGLPDGSVDAVTSCYAFEYGNDELTAEEIVRVLRAGGKARLLMHYAGSKIISGARNESDVLDAELDEDGFLDCVRDYLREFGDIRKPPQLDRLRKSGKAEPFRLRMNEAHQKAVARVVTEHSLKLVQSIAKRTGELVSPPMFFESRQFLLRELKKLREELEASRTRVRDIQGAAVDEGRMERITRHFRNLGCTVQGELFSFPDAPVPVGWQVDVIKPE